MRDRVPTRRSRVARHVAGTKKAHAESTTGHVGLLGKSRSISLCVVLSILSHGAILAAIVPPSNQPYQVPRLRQEIDVQVMLLQSGALNPADAVNPRPLTRTAGSRKSAVPVSHPKALDVQPNRDASFNGPTVSKDDASLPSRESIAAPAPGMSSAASVPIEATPTGQITPTGEAKPRAATPIAVSGAPTTADSAARSVPVQSARDIAETRRASEVARAHYASLLRAAIERSKQYPELARRRGVEGTVVVSFRVSRNGHVSGLIVAHSSGHELLDRAALAAISLAGAFPSVPFEVDGQYVSVEVPLVFRLAKQVH
ncbi:MAG TPA: energy transducer TonB [Polyangiaceae bacterium]|nr:energy transducer TonB [Polyangiaceae bacterium]